MDGKFCGLSVMAAILILALPKPVLGADSLAEANSLLVKLQRDRMAGTGRDPAWRKQFQVELKSVTAQVHHLVDQGILEKLNQGEPPTGDELQLMLRAALRSSGEPDPYSARVLTQTETPGILYVVAYAIGYSAISSLSLVRVYGPVKGKFKLLAQADDPLPNRTIDLAPLPSPTHEKVMFLLYGINWGDPHNHLTVIGYAFDGRKLTTLLTRSALVQGQVKVEGQQIELTFLTIAQGPGYPPAPKRTEIYRITSSGVELKSTSEKKLK